MDYPHKPVPEEVNHRVEAAFARQGQGKITYAAAVYREVLARYPMHPRALHYLGRIIQQSGNPTQAIRLLERSIEADPTDSSVHNYLGQIHVRLNDKPRATACFERGLQIDPDNVALLNNLANVTMPDDLLKAIALFRQALALSPESASVTYGLAQALAKKGLFDEAVELYQRTLVLDPQHIQARQNLGLLHEQQGQFVKAIEQYLTIQQLNPLHVISLANVFAIRDFVPDAAAMRRAEQMLKAENVDGDDKIRLHRGLGKYYERTGSYEQAFSHFKEAKTIFRRGRPAFDIAAVADVMRRLRQVYGREFFSAEQLPITDSAQPIFIVGLHRSGTTLAEQIIASHPHAFGAGELQDIPRLTKSLRPNYPECMANLDSGTLTKLATGYLDTLAGLAGPDTLRVTDKMPLNSLHLGLIAKLFPKAHIIYCRRDPLDIAVSCFMELIELYHDYTVSFEEFGQYFLEHERLMDHWRKVLPIPIYELRYEELVADPEAACRALIRFCGLEWHPACLEFQNTDRTVQTPSRWQVRQPIYQTSIGRWRRYRSHMAGLIQFLDAAGYRYPRNAPAASDD